MKKDKLKRNLIIIIAIIAIIATTIFVLYNVTDIFRTKRGAFFRYFAQIPDMADILDTSSEYDNYKKTKESMPYTTSGEMTIYQSQNIADDAILNKIKMTVEGKTDPQNEKSNANISIKSGNRELFNMSTTRDKKMYGFFAPQIADGYIAVRNENLSELAKSMRLKNANKIPDQVMPVNINEILNTSNTEKKHISKYIKMIRNKAPDTSYSKDTKQKIEIEGKKYTTNSYTLKLNAEQNSNLQINILEEMITDSIMMNYITSKCRLMNLTGDCTDINLLNTKLRKRIETLKNSPSEAGDFIITLYEYKQRNIQTEIKFKDTTIKITYLNIEENNFVRINIQDKDGKDITLKIEKKDEEYTVKLQKNEDDILKSIEFMYSMEGTVSDNNIQNHLTINIVDDIKNVSFKYNDTISFTNDIGSFKEMQEDKVAIVNDYQSEDIQEFVDLLKKQINSVYINQASKVGINLDPIFR